MSTATNVSTGKPATGGAIYVAPFGSTLPTDATTALDAAFTALGYCSEDGLVNNNSPESDTVSAWGKDKVLVLQTGKEDTFSFTLIESLNEDVIETIYGSNNVSGSLAAGLTIKANADEPEEMSWCFEMIMRGNIKKRISVPCAMISEIGEIAYTDDGAVGYQITITAIPDASGNTHYEYMK